jgi:tetratricopeptide (TPR) repeat protein
LAESVAEADRAAELAPRESGAFVARTNARAGRRLLEALLPLLGQPGGDARKIHQAVFHMETVPDLQAAARLARTNALAWGTAALYEALAEGFQRDLASVDEMVTRDLWAMVPEATRRSVRQALSQIEEIGQGAEARRSAAALATLGSLQCFLLRDQAGGVASLRRALALDPANENAWETLTFALAMAREFPPLLEVCQSRLKQTDSLRNRVLLAKAYERNNQPDAMLQTLQEAYAGHRDNLLANLALGAALLKVRGDDEVARARALQCLIRAGQLAGESPPPEVATELLFQRALYFALSGQAAVARAGFRQLLELDPGNADALAALQALEQTGE